ncbi:29 kDa ribonucleoprotein A, chloroplastic [Linum perenne]
MAAIGAGAISSSFSSHILKCTQNSRLLLHNPFLPSSNSSSSFRIPTSARLSLSVPGTSPDPFPIAASTWRHPKVYAPAVAQDEAQTETAAAAEVTEETETVAAKVAEETAVATPAAEGELKIEEEGEESRNSESTKLYIGNLPFNVDSSELAAVIQDHGTPELIEVLYNRETGKSRGFAFVTMATIEDCDSVIQNMDGKEFMGRALRVNMADKPRPKQPLYPETEHKLFVGNVSWSVTSESLTEAFQSYGNVVFARVLYDGETGRSRGYGFVCYSTASEMQAALEAADGLELEGRALRVSLAEGRK